MLKGGIKTAHNKSLKKSYTALSAKQLKMIKIHERYEIADRFLYGYRGFYSDVKRLTNNCVDWSSVSANMMTAFDSATKDIDKYIKQDKKLMDQALILFNQTQFNFGQSF